MHHRFSWYITLVPIAFIIITAGLISYKNIYELQQTKKVQIEEAKEQFFQEQKSKAKDRVDFSLDSISHQRNKVLTRVRGKVKTRVDEAIYMANKYYEKYKDIYSEDVLKEHLKTIFSNMITKHKDGYLFAVDMQSEKIIIHKIKQLVGYSMSLHQDVRDTFVLKEQKALLSKSDGAFQTIYFKKPTSPDLEFPKQIYIRYFKPFNWLIGTGEYLDDMEKEIQSFIINRFSDFKDEDESYIFIYKVSDTKEEKNSFIPLIEKDLDLNSKHIKKESIRKILELIKKEGKGYVKYDHFSKNNAYISQKTSYLHYDSQWKWLVGSGFRYKTLEDKLNALSEDIDRKINMQILDNFIITLLVAFIMAFVSFFILKAISKVIDNYAKKQEEQRRMFQTLFDKSKTGAILFNQNGQIFDCNEAILEMMKITTKGEFLNRDFKVFSSLKQPNGVLTEIEIQRRIDECLQRGTSDFEWLHVNSKKEEFWCYIILTKLQLDDEVIIHALVQNINDKKILEKENLKQKEVLTHQNKMAAMGELIRNIAHQWRQPLSVISGISNNILLDMELKHSDEEVTKEHVRNIIQNTKRLSKTIEDFSDFFKPTKVAKKFSLQFLMERVFNFLKIELEQHDISVISNIKNISAQTYPDALMQVMINLLNNSKDALVESKQEKYIFIDVEEDKNKIAIYIKDSGGGIEEDIIDRIEEPYFSTKHPSSGTGMGLYMSYVLITKHMQGEIKMENKEFEYESRMYKGLLVTIELPKIKK